MRKIFGIVAGIVAYAPFIGLAYWLGKYKETIGLIAAALFVFFGFIFAMAVFSGVGFPDKETQENRSASVSESSKPKKGRSKNRDTTDLGGMDLPDADLFDDSDEMDD